MFVISDQKVRLDASMKSLEICDADWAIDPEDHTMQHLPTRTLFEIEMDKKRTEGEPLTPADFYARLMAIFAPCELPSSDAIERLGREALMLYFAALGYMRQTEARDMAVTEALIRNARAC
jgi:hypothetical protein